MTACSKYFSVVHETQDFVSIKLNLDEEFNGATLQMGGSRNATEFAQYLLDEHQLVQSGSNGSGVLVCHKVRSNKALMAELIDKLYRQGVI